VAFGALGTPIITLARVHNYDVMALSQMVGRQLPFFSLLVPFWLIWVFAGRKAMMEIWPAILVTGATFALSQFLVSNYIGPELVDVIAAIVSMASLVGFLKVWHPKRIWTSTSLQGRVDNSRDDMTPDPVLHAAAAKTTAFAATASPKTFAPRVGERSAARRRLDLPHKRPSRAIRAPTSSEPGRRGPS